MKKLLVLQDDMSHASVLIGQSFFDELKKSQCLKSFFYGLGHQEVIPNEEFDAVFIDPWIFNRLKNQTNHECWNFLRKLKCKKFALVCDYFYRREEYNNLWESIGVTEVLCWNDSAWTENSEFNWKFRYFPFSCDPVTFKDHKLEKQYDVAISGGLDENLYPMRLRIHRLLTSQSEISYKYFKPVFSYDKYETTCQSCGFKNNIDPSMLEYSRNLNSAKINFTDGQYREVLVAKYSEIANSNSLVMSPKFENSKDLDFFGFKEDENIFYISYSDSDDDILRKIKDLIKNKEKLKKMTDSSYNMARKFHTNSNRVKYLYNLI